MTYKDTRDIAYIEEIVRAAYMAGELERLALERVNAARAANGISIEGVEIRTTDLAKFLRGKGYSGWIDYAADVIAIENCRNNPITLKAKTEPVGRQREVGGCYDRLAKKPTSKGQHISMF
jgi:hypothetical protein